MIERWANGDGTYNGVRMLAELSGLSAAEVAWTAARIKHLVVVEKKPAAEAKAIVAAEAQGKPWMVAS